MSALGEPAQFGRAVATHAEPLETSVVSSNALVRPVPPLASAMAVPVHVPLVIVPTVAISVPISFDAAIEPARSAFATEAHVHAAEAVSDLGN